MPIDLQTCTRAWSMSNTESFLLCQTQRATGSRALLLGVQHAYCATALANERTHTDTDVHTARSTASLATLSGIATQFDLEHYIISFRSIPADDELLGSSARPAGTLWKPVDTWAQASAG